MCCLHGLEEKFLPGLGPLHDLFGRFGVPGIKPTFQIRVHLSLRLYRLLRLARCVSEPLGQIKLLGKLAENRNRHT